MAKNIFIKNNLTKETLLKIAEIGILTIPAISSPYFLHKVIKKYFKNKINERVRKLRDLEKRKLLNIEELRDGSIRISLAHLGNKVIYQYKLEAMDLKKSEKWDGEWRVVTYDIPQGLRRASNAFREKIRSLGLYRLQRSVWVSPYDCLSELEFLCAVFEIPAEDCLCYFKAKNIPKETQIKRFFKL